MNHILVAFLLVLLDSFAEPQTTRGCVLPVGSPWRFCPVWCAGCSLGSATCHAAAGSPFSGQVVRVECAPGNRLADDQNFTVVACHENNWVGQFPECLPQCPPLKSESVVPHCRYYGREVDCGRALMPGTTATAHCKLGYSPYLGLLGEGVYRRVMRCLFDGTWSGQLPECKPDCGISKGSAIVEATVALDGLSTPLGVFPWHAGLYSRQGEGWEYICGGTLISRQVVLTAAHCIRVGRFKDLRVTFAKYYREWNRDEKDTVKRNVSDISIPKEFSHAVPTLLWDIALLLLSEPVTFNSFVMPVCLTDSLVVDPTKEFTGFVVGWGKTAADGEESEFLLHNNVSVVLQNSCSRDIPKMVVFDKFCASKNATSVVEKGDSGGGLTVAYNHQHHLLGIVSVKYNNVSVFTNVSWATHVNWRISEMNKFEDNLSRCPKNGFLCGLAGPCLSRSVRCDGYQQCPDGSDEAGCAYEPENTTTAGECKLPTQPDHGRFRVTVDEAPARLSIEYSCQAGYRLSAESPVASCLRGQWNTSALSCLTEAASINKVLCPTLKSDTMDVQCWFDEREINCLESMRPGTKATFKCKPSHSQFQWLAAEHAAVHVCLSNGKWSRPMPECKPDCGVSVALSEFVPDSDIRFEDETTTTTTRGENAQPGMYPWHAGLYKYDSPKEIWEYFCGGSLVTSRIVITAAHCITTVTPTEVQVALGKVFKTFDHGEKTAQKRSVIRIEFPREFNTGLSYTWDIGLLLLNKPVQISRYVMPVCHNARYTLDTIYSKPAFMARWGSDQNNPTPEILQHTNFSIIDMAVCRRQVPSVLTGYDKFCGAKKGAALSVVQKGDSGGGVTSVFDNKHFIVGVASLRYENVSMFTNVTYEHIENWMNRQIFNFELQTSLT